MNGRTLRSATALVTEALQPPRTWADPWPVSTPLHLSSLSTLLHSLNGLPEAAPRARRAADSHPNGRNSLKRSASRVDAGYPPSRSNMRPPPLV